MHPRTRELLDCLDRHRAVLQSAWQAVPEGARETRPADGGWSPAQIVEHVATVTSRVAARVAAASADLPPETGTDPILPTIDVSAVLNRETRVMAPDAIHPRGMSAAEAWASVEQAGVALREAVRLADGKALGAASFPHPLFGPMTLYQWIAFTGAHESRHAAQIREQQNR